MQVVATLLKLACALSKLVAIVMKVVDYTNCKLIHD